MAKHSPNGSENIADLEQHRLRLEENSIKLQKSLRHWQTWEADYEGLKEDILGLRDGYNKSQLKRVSDDFEGELLSDNDIKLLLEDSDGQQRESSQIIGLLNRRIDYVQDNVKSIKSLLEAAEVKATASDVLTNPETGNEEGLPLHEIREELDEEGNVISSSITSPSDTTPHIVGALRKAAGKGTLEQGIRATEKNSDHSISKPANKGQLINNRVSESVSISPGHGKANDAKNLTSGESETSVGDGKPSVVRRKKSVSFAEGTKVADATGSSQRNSKKRDQRAANALTARMREYVHNDKILDELDRIERHHKTIKSIPSCSNPTAPKNSDNSPQHEAQSERRHAKDVDPFLASIPQDESPEDAALRREMIRYNMGDVGAVVAEIDMDDEGSDFWSEDDSSAEEDDDQFGRTKRRVISDDYRKEMETLERKLNAKVILNTGPSDDKAEFERAEYNERNRGDQIRQGYLDFEPQKASPTKEVRFADEVGEQIATTIASSQNAEKAPGVSKAYSTHSPEPGQPLPSASSAMSSPGKKASLFKISRQATPEKDSGNDTSTPPSISKSPAKSHIMEKSTATATPTQSTIPPSPPTPHPPSKHHPNPFLPPPHEPPSEPHISIINAQIIERPFHTLTDINTFPPPPSEPDELDPTLLQQQAATEYHRMRNRMIQRQGGFLAEAEAEANEGKVSLANEEEEEEEGGGGERKMSRFKAARLRRR